MLRTIVTIDEEKCDGCGLCIPNCHEGAIKIIDGKARLVADSLCDGMGNCLGHCPQDAIKLEQREADAFDELAVVASGGSLEPLTTPKFISPALGLPAFAGLHAPSLGGQGGGCPGSRMVDRTQVPQSIATPQVSLKAIPASCADAPPLTGRNTSELRQWPVQLHLVNPAAPYFQRADVVLASDCSAFAVGDFHQKFLKGKTLAIACPKLDDGQDRYQAKLKALVENAGINTLTVIRMEVPCCFGLTSLAQAALAGASRKVPLKEIVVSLEGEILEENWV